MRLLIINQFYKPDISATAHLAASLAEHRAQRGDHVTVIASQGGYLPSSELVKADPTDNPVVKRIWTPRLGKATLLNRATDYGTFYLFGSLASMRLPRQDAIIAMTTPPAIGWAGVLHRMMHPHTKLILWNMDCYPELGEATGVVKFGGLISRTLRAANGGVFRHLDHLVCLDSSMARLLHRNYVKGRRNLPTTIIPNWEPASLYPADVQPPPWAPAENLDLHGCFTVLYLGNIGAAYHFDTLIEVAEIMLDDPVRFLIVGSGAQWDYVVQAVAERSLHNIIMHGYVPKEHTPSVIATADCSYVSLNQRCDGMCSPSKLHATLAMGLPVIFTGPEGGNVDEAITQFGCGVSLRQGQALEIASFLRALMQNPVQLATLGKNARRAFEQAYCDTRVLPKFDRLLENL